jgi:hypothetical protein
MKKIVIFVLSVSVSLTPFVAFAGIGLPFGGLVLTSPTPGATCPSGAPVSPYAITPLAGLPGLYVSTQWVAGVGLITPSAYILGLYVPTPIPECVSVPPFNNAFHTTIYGTNRF